MRGTCVFNAREHRVSHNESVRKQAPDSETSLTPVFLSSTCFRPSGAAQQQLLWASWILHLGPPESDVYSDVIQEAQ